MRRGSRGSPLPFTLFSRRLVSTPNETLTAGRSYLILDAELLDSAGVSYLVEDDAGARKWVSYSHFVTPEQARAPYRPLSLS